MEGVAFNSLTGKADYARAGGRRRRAPGADACGGADRGRHRAGPERSGHDRSHRRNSISTVKSTPIDIALFQAATTQLTKMTGQMQAERPRRGHDRSAAVERAASKRRTPASAFTATGVTYSNALARLHVRRRPRCSSIGSRCPTRIGDQLVAIGELGIVRRSVGADERAGVGARVQGAGQPVRSHRAGRRPSRHRRCDEAADYRRAVVARTAGSKSISCSSS